MLTARYIFHVGSGTVAGTPGPEPRGSQLRASRGSARICPSFLGHILPGANADGRNALVESCRQLVHNEVCMVGDIHAAVASILSIRINGGHISASQDETAGYIRLLGRKTAVVAVGDSIFLSAEITLRINLHRAHGCLDWNHGSAVQIDCHAAVGLYICCRLAYHHTGQIARLHLRRCDIVEDEPSVGGAENHLVAGTDNRVIGCRDVDIHGVVALYAHTACNLIVIHFLATDAVHIII